MIHQDRPQGGRTHGVLHSGLHGCHWICAAALSLLPLLVLAQEAAQPAATATPIVVAAPAPLQSDSSEEVAPLALHAVPAEQYSLPAGVCPVITDYLYQQCQQNPADAMCAPATATE
jgi:hypothetical protein